MSKQDLPGVFEHPFLANWRCWNEVYVHLHNFEMMCHMKICLEGFIKLQEKTAVVYLCIVCVFSKSMQLHVCDP